MSNPDLVQPDQLLASILAQSASDPDYVNCILSILTSAEGAEVYLRDPSLFGIPTGWSGLQRKGGSTLESSYLA